MNTTEQGEPQGPVTVQVAVGGVYHVTVFPSKRSGIFYSNVAFEAEVVVSVTASPTGMLNTPTENKKFLTKN